MGRDGDTAVRPETPPRLSSFSAGRGRCAAPLFSKGPVYVSRGPVGSPTGIPLVGGEVHAPPNRPSGDFSWGRNEQEKRRTVVSSASSLTVVFAALFLLPRNCGGFTFSLCEPMQDGGGNLAGIWLFACYVGTEDVLEFSRRAVLF